MEIFVVRHTTPDVAKGICYGQTDLGVKDSFIREAEIIRQHLPARLGKVYSSPLRRCKQLAVHLFPEANIEEHHDLKELNCGVWEMKAWDDIPKEEINPWMEDFVNVRIPGGENYVDLYTRVVNAFEAIAQNNAATNTSRTVIFTHGGVMRSLLAHVTQTALQDSFTAFNIHYGCVMKLQFDESRWSHVVLSNIPHDKETHRPSSP